MAKKGDMLYAWTNDADIAKKAECGGAVTEPAGSMHLRPRWLMRFLPSSEGSRSV